MLTTPRDLPAPGGRQRPIRRLTTSASVFFDKRRLDPSTVTDLSSGSKSLHRNRHPFSQYRAICRFLNHSSPDRLGMLYPPTCVPVCGTEKPQSSLRVSWKYGLLSHSNCFVRHLSVTRSAFHYFSAYYVPSRDIEPPSYLLRHPHW